ncbi:MAG: 2Fe-2S iron-sulfur cluster binding domain-containing protein [Jatrophihabitantaceae bacterium]
MRRGAGTGHSATPEADPPNNQPAQLFLVEVQLAGSVVSFQAQSDEYVLDAAIRQGVALAHLCRQGWCTRCAVRLEHGEVDQSGSRRFFEEDRQAGFCLICTGRPLSPLRVVADQHQAIRDHRIALGLPVPRG